MKPSKMLSYAFWAGFVANICLHNAMMNWIGKEDWLKSVDEGWIGLPWAIWLLAAFIAMAVYKHLQRQVNE